MTTLLRTNLKGRWELTPRPVTYTVFVVLGIIMICLILLYIVFYCYTTIRNWRSRIQRHKTVFIYSVAFAVGVSLMMVTNLYRYSGFKEVDVLMAVFISNLYGYLLLIFYSPGKKGKQEIGELKRDTSSGINVQDRIKQGAVFEQELFSGSIEDNLGSKQTQQPPKLRSSEDKVDKPKADNKKDQNDTINDFDDEKENN